MTITKASKENFNMQELFNLTMTPEAQKLSDLKDSIVDFTAWCVYEDVNSEGETQTLFSLVTPEGETYATNSKTFREAFLRIVDLSAETGEAFNRVKVSGGISKAGREFITAVLA